MGNRLEIMVNDINLPKNFVLHRAIHCVICSFELSILKSSLQPLLPCSIISTKFLKWGKIAHPIKMAICWTILIPVWRACHDFLLRHTAFKNGNKEGIPRAEATTAKALQWIDHNSHVSCTCTFTSTYMIGDKKLNTNFYWLICMELTLLLCYGHTHQYYQYQVSW